MQPAIIRLFVLLGLGLPAACQIVRVEIGENGYRSLSPEDKQHILHANPATLPEWRDTSQALTLYEVNSDDIKAFSRSSRLTWVHLWTTWCKNEDCVDIRYLERLNRPYAHSGLRFLMVSRTYDFEQIRERLDNAGFPYPVLVVENARYGVKLRAASKQFYSELGLGEECMDDDFVFADTVLVFHGTITDNRELDSLMVAHPKGWSHRK